MLALLFLAWGRFEPARVTRQEEALASVLEVAVTEDGTPMGHVNVRLLTGQTYMVDYPAAGTVQGILDELAKQDLGTLVPGRMQLVLAGQRLDPATPLRGLQLQNYNALHLVPRNQDPCAVLKREFADLDASIVDMVCLQPGLTLAQMRTALQDMRASQARHDPAAALRRDFPGSEEAVAELLGSGLSVDQVREVLEYEASRVPVRALRKRYPDVPTAVLEAHLAAGTESEHALVVDQLAAKGVERSALAFVTAASKLPEEAGVAAFIAGLRRQLEELLAPFPADQQALGRELLEGGQDPEQVRQMLAHAAARPLRKLKERFPAVAVDQLRAHLALPAEEQERGLAALQWLQDEVTRGHERVPRQDQRGREAAEALAGTCAPQSPLARVLREIDARLAAGQTVLVHCQQGVDRSATVVTAYLMAAFKLSTTEARRATTAVRFITRDQVGGPEDGGNLYEAWLRRHEAELHALPLARPAFASERGQRSRALRARTLPTVGPERHFQLLIEKAYHEVVAGLFVGGDYAPKVVHRLSAANGGAPGAAGGEERNPRFAVDFVVQVGETATENEGLGSKPLFVFPKYRTDDGRYAVGPGSLVKDAYDEECAARTALRPGNAGACAEPSPTAIPDRLGGFRRGAPLAPDAGECAEA